MKNTVFLTLCFLLVSVTVDAGEMNPYEMPRTQVIPINDSESKGQYELYIKLPEDYAKNKDDKYPVIYSTDAVWHFEILSAATEFMLEDVILVGISWRKDITEDLQQKYGEHASRFTDYSFWTKANSKHPLLKFGQAENHLEFIRNDIIEYVDNNYRTDPDSRTYFGYSLSGAFGAYILLTKPDTFDNYILGSPLNKGLIPYLLEINTKLGALESNKNKALQTNVFIGYGTLEKDKPEPINEFIDLIDRKRGISVQSEVIEGDHQTAFPLIAVRSVSWLSTVIRNITSNDDEISLNRSSPIGFLKIPQLNKAFVNTTPEDREDGIAVGELGVDAGNKDMIVKLAEEIADHNQGRFNSFLISHKNKLIFESYYGRGRINLPHQQASATKAYTALLLGRAIQLGYLTMEDLDKPLVSFLKDLDSSKFVDGVEKITLSKALTMRGGLTINRDEWKELKKDPNSLKGQGQLQVLFEHSETITAESQEFSYGNFNPDMVMQVIEAVVPGTAIDFLKNELFEQLGITNYIWKTTVSGVAEADERSKLTSRDMIKIGTLVSNKGKWNGEQLIPDVFIEKVIQPHLYTDDDYKVHYGGKDVSNQGYGYFWWNADLKSGGKTYFSSSAQGGWGQFIILIEELELMVVFTGLDNDTKYLQLVAERVLPAFIR
ncbi:alpha/beta hydrolase-fold protein [Kangiella sp. TOML190]|uniref:alpha/beta hydrolase-fold protein n=1 Tax=Kangiella sp. TOML190 TaxID=2931351 RepID=UPI00203C349E|nr:serine hydrolase [Kangiella sp. TOML190]